MAKKKRNLVDGHDQKETMVLVVARMFPYFAKKMLDSTLSEEDKEVFARMSFVMDRLFNPNHFHGSFQPDEWEFWTNPIEKLLLEIQSEEGAA